VSTVEPETLEFRAEARWVRTAPRKAQAVVSEIRGQSVVEARTALRFMTRGAARDVAKVLDSAVANAESHPLSSYDAESLYVSAAYVGSGPTLKRWQARARGRVGRIRKRTCHITVRLAPIPGAVALPTASVAEEPGRRGRRRAEAAPPAADAALETPVAAESAAVAEVEAPVEAAVEEAPPEEKPKRARRAKATAEETEAAAEKTEVAVEETEVAAEETEAEAGGEAASPAAETTKRTRTRAKKPADPAVDAPAVEETADEAPKPRRSRKKPEDSSSDQGTSGKEH
jgi:large subunit ribosomal protein L22